MYVWVVILLVATPLIMCDQLIPTTSHLEEARTKIINIIEVNAETRPDASTFIAGFVRLSFHDCVGPGNCDGCIDHTLGDNAGLLKYTEKLDEAYDDPSDEIYLKMSRADFYMFSGYVALEEASKDLADKFQGAAEFKVGRASCSTSPIEDSPPNPANPFPAGTFSLQKTLDFFSTEFDFDVTDSVAILGAHTLGKAVKENSGFEGKWVTGKNKNVNRVHSDILDNLYYQRLGGDWTQVSITHNSKTRWQWQRPETTPNDQLTGKKEGAMLMNPDMALLANLETIDPIGPDGKVTCNIVIPRSLCNNCCAKSITNTDDQNDAMVNFFQLYKDDNAKWLEDFTKAFLKMTHLNDATLQVPGLPNGPNTKDVPAPKDSYKELLNELNDIQEDVQAIKKSLN